MEVSRLGVESELQLLQLLTYTTATAMPGVCDLHYSSWQCWILNPLSRAKDRTCVLMDTKSVLLLLSHNGNSHQQYFKVPDNSSWSQGWDQLVLQTEIFRVNYKFPVYVVFLLFDLCTRGLCKTSHLTYRPSWPKPNLCIYNILKTK